MVKLGTVVMILDLHRQGLSVSAIARQSGLDRKTVRRTIERGLELPTYGPRQPRPTLLDPFTGYLRQRVLAYPGLTGARVQLETPQRSGPSPRRISARNAGCWPAVSREGAETRAVARPIHPRGIVVDHGIMQRLELPVRQMCRLCARQHAQSIGDGGGT